MAVPPPPGSLRRRGVLLPILLYAGLTLPYACTKLNGDETHFVTVPYLILGGDYTVSALKHGEIAKALTAGGESYALAWRYFVRPADAKEDSAASLSKYAVESTLSGRKKPFVFTPDYFVTHRKAGKPLLGFLLNVPALAATYLLPRDLYAYQRDHIYHPAFLAPRLVVWLLGICIAWLIYRIVSERAGRAAGFRAALIFCVYPVTVVWSADIHQDVPLTFFLLPYFYFLWKRRWVWAAVFWGLAFATKNQAALALAPILMEGIWQAWERTGLRERATALMEAARIFLVVAFLGTVVSTPFGHPIANWVEVFQTSALDITEIQSPLHLLYGLPLWLGIGTLAMLGLKFLDDARDVFDRMHLFLLALTFLLFFMHDYRTYMFVPSAAILVGTYFRPRTAHLLAAAFILVNLLGLHSPYLTSRRLLYKWLNQPGAPQTIEEIERQPGVGGIRDEGTSGPAPPSQPPPAPPNR